MALRKDSTFGLLLGTNGTGKSTKLLEITKAAIEGGKRVLIIPSSPAEQTFKGIPYIKPHQVKDFTGVKRIECFEEKEFVEVILDLKDCVLISDDFRNYLYKSTLHKDVRRFFIKRRHIHVHVFMAAHSFGQVPPEMYNWINVIMLFKTNDPVARYKHKFLDPAEAEATQARINKIALENPYYHEMVEMQ